MRVLFCTDTYPPQVNGVSIVTSLSVAGLSRLGWDCAVVMPRYPVAAHRQWAGGDTEHPVATEVLRLPSVAMPGYPEIRLAWPGLSQVGALVERFRPDLIHCATEFSVGRTGQITARRAGVPLVSSFHTDFGRYTEAYGMPRLRSVASAYLRRFHRRSRRVYTPSTASREEVLRLGVSDVETWGRGVDVELFHPGRRSQDMRAALGMGSRFTFLYVGRLAAEKCVEHVIEAFRIAEEYLPKGMIHLVVAGTGPREDEIRAASPPGVTFLRLSRATEPPARSVRQLRRLRLCLGDRDARTRAARGDGQRSTGGRGARGRRERPSARRRQWPRLSGGRRCRDGAGDGASGG